MLVQVRALSGGRGAVFIFNTGDEAAERAYPLEALGLPDTGFVHNWLSGQSLPAAVRALPVRLEPHDGALLLVSPQPWADVPERFD